MITLILIIIFMIAIILIIILMITIIVIILMILVIIIIIITMIGVLSFIFNIKAGIFRILLGVIFIIIDIIGIFTVVVNIIRNITRSILCRVIFNFILIPIEDRNWYYTTSRDFQPGLTIRSNASFRARKHRIKRNFPKFLLAISK
jgi:hypothetical protein